MKSEVNTNNDYSITLGITFLRQFAAEFNVEDQKILLAPSIYAVRGVNATHGGYTPATGNDSHPFGLSVLEIIIFASIGFFLLIIIIALCCWYCNKRKEEELDRTIDSAREHLQKKYGGA